MHENIGGIWRATRKYLFISLGLIAVAWGPLIILDLVTKRGSGDGVGFAMAWGLNISFPLTLAGILVFVFFVARALKMSSQ